MARRELWIAGVGAATAVLLAVFALGPWADPAAARARARRDHARAAQANLAAAWTALRVDGLPGIAIEPEYRWRAGETGRPSRREPRPARASAAGGSRAFATKLSAAEVLEVYDTDAAAALAQVLGALDDPRASDGQRAIGRLRAVQLAARAGRVDVVREQWALASAELDGAETVDGLPVLLSLGLAAARVLPPDERCAIARALSSAWGSGALALADEAPEVEAGEGIAPPVVREDPALAALAARLASLAADGARDEVRESDDAAAATADDSARDPGNDSANDSANDVAHRLTDAEDCLDPAFRARRERWRAVALAGRIGGLPEPLDLGRWELRATAAGPFALRSDARGAREGAFVDPRALGAALLDRVAAARDRGAWTVEVAPGSLVGDGVLLGGWLRVAPDGAAEPASVRAAGRTALVLRWGLVVAALAIASAGFVTARALARERRLGALKSTFVANVSHELRTPLASILLMSENLEEGRVRDESARGRYYANLRREAQRLSRLVGDVLDFARLERGAGPRLEREDLPLDAWWDQVAREAADRAARDGATLEAEAHGLAGEHAAADGEALRRVVMNLVDNAVKYGVVNSGAARDEGSVGAREERRADVRVTARVDGNALVLTVGDRGRGIPANERERVFDAFRRLDDGVGPAGTGLGLAICRALVEAHGGTIAVDANEDGRGARFTARVPLDGDDDLHDHHTQRNGDGTA